MENLEKQVRQSNPIAVDSAVFRTVASAPDDQLLTPREVCAMLKMADPETGKAQTGTLANWRYLGKGPTYIRFGESKYGPVRYHLSAVLEWINDHTHRSTSEE